MNKDGFKLGIIGDMFKILTDFELCTQDESKVCVCYKNRGKDTIDIIPRSDAFIISETEFTSLMNRYTGCIHVIDMNLKDIVLNFEYGMLYKWRMGTMVRTSFFIPQHIYGQNRYSWEEFKSGVGYKAQSI